MLKANTTKLEESLPDQFQRECSYCHEWFYIRSHLGGQIKFCSDECRHNNNLRKCAQYRAANRPKIRKRSAAMSKAHRTGSIKGSLQVLVRGAKSRAKQKQLQFDLDLDYILYLYDQQKGLCCKTGVLLTPCAGGGTGSRKPSTISIDRIDSSLGYTKTNVQLVCWWYNVAKANWDEQEVLRYARAYITTTYPESRSDYLSVG